LFGDVNPSGKLPATFEKRWEDNPCFPYYHLREDNKTPYTEGIFIGYRGYDEKKIEPLFPFGYGLSYTHFKYSKLNLIQNNDPKNPLVTVEFELSNAGDRAGAEVAEIYVQPIHPGVIRPLKELKGFKKVFLQPGEKQTISIPLDRDAFAYYDVNKKDWVAEKGEYKILIGGSSRDIRLNGAFALPESL
jgi:beta-glucosidase